MSKQKGKRIKEIKETILQSSLGGLQSTPEGIHRFFCTNTGLKKKKKSIVKKSGNRTNDLS